MKHKKLNKEGYVVIEEAELKQLLMQMEIDARTIDLCTEGTLVSEPMKKMIDCRTKSMINSVNRIRELL